MSESAEQKSLMHRPAIGVVLQQHVEDAAVLHGVRTSLLAAPHVKLHQLRRFDDRLAAHLDGIAIAGNAAASRCDAALESPTPGAVFVATVAALTSSDEAWLERLLTLATTVPELRSGVASAFGWLEGSQLQGVVARRLASHDAAERALAVAACSMHRVDAAPGSVRLLEDPEDAVRARAYRMSAELGKREWVSRLAGAIAKEQGACQFWAAWAAVVLGDRLGALDHLLAVSLQDGPFQKRAHRLALIATSLARAHEHLRSLAMDTAQLRRIVEGAGLVGDPTYVPWLMKHMSDDKLARLAGESFSLITGADLALLDLERKPPENFESGPNDDPNDANVAMDEDDGLPWPDLERVQRWWSRNSSLFVSGQRYFVGAPVTREHCIEVLQTGYQRQRILAAYHLCLFEPGSVLFEWRAPAWRQSQALAALG